MITIKDAAQKALDYSRQVFADVDDVLLEEVEMDESKNYWLITLSFPTVAGEMNPLVTLGTGYRRRYKIFKVDAESGDVVSMKIRQLQQ